MDRIHFKRYIDYQREKEQIKQISEEIAILQEMCVPSQILTGMPRSGKISDSTAVIGSKLAELNTSILMKKHKIAEYLEEVERFVEPLEPRERYLIRAHYIMGLSFCEIADEMHYSERHVYNIHKRIVERVQ